MNFFLIVFYDIFLLIKASHFLGGSFTYRQNPNENFHRDYLSIFVEIRFHISHHYFQCTDERVNQHMEAYLVGDNIPYDSRTNTYQWFEVNAYRNNPLVYNIDCQSNTRKRMCDNFNELTWAYCESANEKLQYSILRRQFALRISRFETISISHEACCWANSLNKKFSITLTINPILQRNNSSPYPYIPASYYVNYHDTKDIKIFIYDADDDEIQCQTHWDNLEGFLTVTVSHDCRLSYRHNRLGKQFGQFWIRDKRNNEILSNSLISVQVHVLENIICNKQPELIVKNKANNFKLITIEINQPVSILVSLNPNCHNIPIEVQTILELTTFCTNQRPTVTANGGIEIEFQCIPILCQIYYICFIGEFNMTLPSTDVVCFQINATGNDAQCANATRQYNYLEPHERNFKIWKETGKKATSLSEFTTTISNVLLPIKKPTKSRLWLWISIVSVLVICSIGYFCFRYIINANRHNQQLRLSDPNQSLDTIDSDITLPKLPIKSNETHPDNISITSSKSKTRSQQIRLDFLDV